jgi:hypothetical protein
MADEPKTEVPEGKEPEGKQEQQQATPPEPQGKTFTQDDVNRVVSERLQREREKYSDYDALKGKALELDELKAENQSELEKLTGKVGSLGDENKGLKDENLRLRVALSKGLVGEKADLADRLRGKTQEELEADADKLLSHFSPPEKEEDKKEEKKETPPPPSFDGGPREPAPDAKDPAKAHNELVVGLFGGPRSTT